MDETDSNENVVDIRPDPPSLEDVDPTTLVSVGGRVDDVKVHLRFFGDDLIPDEVSAKLETEPTEAFRKGDPLPGPYKRAATTGRWSIDGDYSINDLEDQLNDLLDGLTDDLSVWQDLTGRFDGDVFCGIFLNDINRGFVLSEALVRKLADRNLMIGFDIYAPVT